MFVVLRTALVSLALALAIGASSGAETEQKRFEAIIAAQIEAFARDDGATAFAYASPDIQRMFGNPDRFLEMVRVGYPSVYRPRSFRFETPKVVDGTPVQPVNVIGPDGVGVIALYRMERQPDGSWRIGGVTVHRTGERGI